MSVYIKKWPKIKYIRVCDDCYPNKITFIQLDNKRGRCQQCHMKHLRTLDCYKTAIQNVYDKKRKPKVQNYCKEPDCHKPIGSKSTFCNSCAQTKHNLAWIKVPYAYACIDCGCLIDRHGYSVRCITCYRLYAPGHTWPDEHPNPAKGIPAWNRGLTAKDDIRIKLPSTEHKRLISIANGGTGIPYENKFYCSEWNNKLRNQIRARDGNICKVCDMTLEEHLQKYEKSLHVHHIDYCKTRCVPENLITLCTKCHMRTNKKQDRAYWQSYFQTNFAQQLGVLI